MLSRARLLPNAVLSMVVRLPAMLIQEDIFAQMAISPDAFAQRPRQPIILQIKTLTTLMADIMTIMAIITTITITTTRLSEKSYFPNLSSPARSGDPW